MLGWIFTEILTTYTIGLWAKDIINQNNLYLEYTIKVFSYATGTAVCVFINYGIMFIMSYKTSEGFHKEMIKYVLKAPINLFYDVTPTGIVLNRFSKDLKVIDDFAVYW